MNQYEIAVLYHPDLEVDLSKAEERFFKVISDNGGEVLGSDNWGKRKLAYPIAHNEFAVYVFYSVKLPATSVTKVDSNLNILDEVINLNRQHLLWMNRQKNKLFMNCKRFVKIVPV